MTLGKNKNYLSQLPGSPIRPINPVVVEASSLNDAWRRQETFFAHGGAGDFGQIAFDLNGDNHRKSKLLSKPVLHEVQEALTAISSISRLQKFYISDAPDGEQQLVSGIALTNGNQMGRRRPFPGDIFEPGYHQLISTSLPAFIGNAVRMYAGSPKIMSQRIDSNMYITPKHSGDTILFMFDGETFHVPTGDKASQAGTKPTTRIAIETSAQPLMVVAAHSKVQ